MSANQPWSPTQGATGSAAAEAPSASGPVPSGEKQELIDENDPRLIAEQLDVNVEGDAYAQPAPPPDGKYRAKLKLEGVAQEGSTEKKDYQATQTKKAPVMPYFTTSISCNIIDPSGKYDGITVYPQFGGGASTNRRRDGTTQIATIMARVKKPDGTPWAVAGTKMSQLEWIQLFVKMLKTEPEIGIETNWEASCMACATELKKKGEYPARTTGMHHFPAEQDAAKKKAGLLFQPEMKCQVNPAHGYSRARAIVVKFLHLHELK